MSENKKQPCQSGEEYGPPILMDCGCSWHETTSWTICEECSKLECFKAPGGIKTPLELFEGGDTNLKSSAGVREYRFNSYAVRRITNALTRNPAPRQSVVDVAASTTPTQLKSATKCSSDSDKQTVELAALERARDALQYWKECRDNFATSQNRTEYDQAALDVVTGHSKTIRALIDSAIASHKKV